MGPDWFWVAVFSLGGAAMGFVTSFIGLPKGKEVYGWFGLYAFMGASVVILDITHPFWTVLVGSLGAGTLASFVQISFVDAYRRHNPWYEAELERPTPQIATGFLTFALAAGAVFGLIMGAIAWALSVI